MRYLYLLLVLLPQNTKAALTKVDHYKKENYDIYLCTDKAEEPASDKSTNQLKFFDDLIPKSTAAAETTFLLSSETPPKPQWKFYVKDLNRIFGRSQGLIASLSRKHKTSDVIQTPIAIIALHILTATEFIPHKVKYTSRTFYHQLERMVKLPMTRQTQSITFKEMLIEYSNIKLGIEKKYRRRNPLDEKYNILVHAARAKPGAIRSRVEH